MVKTKPVSANAAVDDSNHVQDQSSVKVANGDSAFIIPPTVHLEATVFVIGGRSYRLVEVANSNNGVSD